ncbi:MAG: hypothetical protein ACREJ2_10740 [Planctomycetota bacterium]
MSNATPPTPPTPPVPPTPPTPTGPPGSPTPPAAPVAPADAGAVNVVKPGEAVYEHPPMEDDYEQVRERELTGRERLLLNALLPSALLLGATNTMMVWLLKGGEYPWYGLQSLGLYALTFFLLGVFFYVKWRYVWSVRKAHHLAFYLRILVEAVAAVALVAMGSYLLGFKFYKTADVTLEQKLSLSDRSKDILRSLPPGAKVEIVLPYQEAGLYHVSELDRLDLIRTRRAVSRVCDEVEQEAPGLCQAQVKFTTLDVDNDPDAAAAIAKRMNLPSLPHDFYENLLVFYTPPPGTKDGAGQSEGERFWFIQKQDLYQPGKFAKNGQSQGMDFVGEGRVLATIQRLQLNDPLKVFFVVDHCPRARAVPGANNMAYTILDNNNLRLLPIHLKTTPVIPVGGPDGADFLLLMNIQDPLSAAECETLYNYVAAGGSMLVCLDPSSDNGQASGLAPFLDKFGLVAEEDRSVHTSVNGASKWPTVLGLPEDMYLQQKLPQDFEWVRQMIWQCESAGGRMFMRTACYLDTPRAISDPQLAAQHARFYPLLTSDQPAGESGQDDIRAVADAVGKPAQTGPFTLAGVVQMYQQYKPGEKHFTRYTHKAIAGKYHHLFVVTDSNWLFDDDQMSNLTNQVFFDAMVQKLAGVEQVEKTPDPTMNYISGDPHTFLLALVTGLLPAIALIIAGYLYLSMRRQVPGEAQRA